MILRLSQKLRQKIDAGPLKPQPLEDNPLLDWSAHLFLADRTQYILFSNTKSLYSSVFLGKEIVNDGQFIGQALNSLRELMEADGMGFNYHRFIAPGCETVLFAKALNRSVTGSVNDLIHHAMLWLSDRETSPFEAGLKLNDVLLSSLASSKSSAYGTPREAFRDLVHSVPTEKTATRGCGEFSG